jgi:uncharacterized protein (DUF58 family)
MSETVSVRITNRVRVLPVVILLLLAVELLWSERVWMMLLLALGGIWLLDSLWARSLARGLRLQRELRYDWAHVGDALEERFTLTNAEWAPALWAELHDGSNLPDYEASVATGVEPHSENNWRIKHICTRRGVFSLGPTTVRTGTPFGIYAVELTYSGQSALMVMPPIVPLPGIEVAPGGRAREGRRRASTFERTVSASGIRDYRPGDPYKAIHWRAAAHYNALMVRTFENTPAGDWWIWLDLEQKAQAGVGENSTTEHAIILAASLAARGLDDGHAVGLVANGREMVWMPPGAGEPQRLQILRALATLEPGAQSLAEMLERTRKGISRNASLILLTPNVAGDWIDTVLALAWSGAVPTVLLLDRETYGGEGSAREVTSLLAEWGIPHFVVTRDLLANLESALPRQGHWEWSVGATGRAIPRAQPADQEWRTLA